MLAKSSPLKTKFPNWLYEHIQDYVTYMKGHIPFPFNQPSDIDRYISLHQNDYLRLSRHPDVLAAKEKANRRTGTGSVASSVFGGDTGEHSRLIETLKDCLQVENVLLTSSGWNANVGLIEAITPPKMPVYLDQHAHASFWDGAKLSPGKPILVRHNNVEYLEKTIKRYGSGIVVIDAFYSTDGSVADLSAYIKLCSENECILVLDEAHSLGMIGKKGGGLAVQKNLAHKVHFRTASLSKALGGNGGLIASTFELISHLKLRVRSSIFSSAPSETNSAGHTAALKIIMLQPERSEECLAMAELFRQYLRTHGIETLSQCQIVSIYFTGVYTAAKLYGELREKGILFSVFCPPATPKNLSSARFSFYFGLTPEQVLIAAEETITAIKKLGLHPISL